MSAVHAFFSKRNEEQNTSESRILQSMFEGKNPVEVSVKNSHFYHIGIQGCCHGELNRIYDACSEHENTTGKKIDLLICCGDFQAMRTPSDLASMAAPKKYLKMGDFHEYWSSDPKTNPPKRTAPYLTVFIGGNHENSEWLAEEYYGGFLAPNIFYIGHSGVIIIDNIISIVGLSGIYNSGSYYRPYPMRPYFTSESNKRSAYHVRQVEMHKLHAFFSYAESQKRDDNLIRSHSTREDRPPEVRGFSCPDKSKINIFVSHDWPAGITKFGREDKLLQIKPFFSEDIGHNTLGNPRALSLLHRAQPDFWIAAHLHCYFRATVPHSRGVAEGPHTTLSSGKNFRDIPGDIGHTSGSSESSSSSSEALKSTSFIALDKCTHRFGFLDFIDIPLMGKSRSVNPELEGSFLGLGRVKRHKLWIDIVLASHSLVAQNTDTDCLLDPSYIREAVMKAFGGTSNSQCVSFEVCATTGELLQKLGLSHPLPVMPSPSPLPYFTLLGREESDSQIPHRRKVFKEEVLPEVYSNEVSPAPAALCGGTDASEEELSLWEEDVTRR